MSITQLYVNEHALHASLEVQLVAWDLHDRQHELGSYHAIACSNMAHKSSCLGIALTNTVSLKCKAEHLLDGNAEPIRLVHNKL